MGKADLTCALFAAAAIAGCGGSEEEGAADEAAAEAPGAAIVRSIRLSGGLTDRTVGMRTFQGCQPAKFSASGEALLNVVVATRSWRPGRYTAHVQPFVYRYRSRQDAQNCQKPDGTWEVHPAYGENDGAVRIGGLDVLLVYDGTTVEIRGALFGTDPNCTGEDLLRGEDVGRANPMMTLTGTARCAYPQFPVTTRTTVKLVGTF